MRTGERGHGSGFALESSFGDRVVRQGAWQHLDRDGAVQPCVVSLVDLAHATGAEAFNDAIWPKARAKGKRHVASTLHPFHLRLWFRLVLNGQYASHISDRAEIWPTFQNRMLHTN